MREFRERPSAFTLIELLVVTAIGLLLAALLTSAFTAARAADHRNACLNQLNLMARGLESYCGDYSQYFPSWTGYGGPTAMVWSRTAAWDPFDDGWYTDPRSRHRVSMLGGGYFDKAHGPPKQWGEMWMYNTPAGKHRTLYSGRNGPSRTSGKGGDGGTIRPAGELNMAPVGLGLLLEGRYVEDARLFFCPSARDKMPPDYLRSARGFTTANAATRLTDLEKAGGYDHRALAYGDWTWMKSFGGGYNGLAVQSTYHYRNTPLSIAIHGKAGVTDTCYLAYTRPAVKAEVGCPAFKTQKLLGARAVVADTFTWHNLDKRATDGTWPDAPKVSPKRPGYAVYHHREGYNVLYGDWHSKWYADPGEEIMWPAWWPRAINDECNWRSLDNNYVFAWRSLDGKEWRHENCSHVIWNQFDMAAGLDVHSTEVHQDAPPPLR